MKTTLNQFSWDKLTVFQQGNLQKALVHKIVLENQSTFFPTRLSERVEQTKNQMGKNMYSTSQYQDILNWLQRFYKQEEVTNDKIAKIIKQSLFMTNQNLWNLNSRLMKYTQTDSLYSIVELLDEKYFTLGVQEKKFRSPTNMSITWQTSWSTTLHDQWNTPYTTDNCYRWRISSGRWVWNAKPVTPATSLIMTKLTQNLSQMALPRW